MILLAGWVLCISGCGGPGNPPTIAVGGTASYKGATLKNGVVRFNPVDPQKGHLAQGTIGSDGKFVLSTFKTGDGAIAGDYNVTVTSSEEGTEGLAKDKGLGIGGKSAIPAKYGDPKTSGIKETIKTGEPKTDLKIDLKE